MTKKSITITIFSAAVLVFLIGYWFLNQPRLERQSRSPSLLPPQLTAEEKARILKTLDGQNKKELSGKEKTKILNSLTAPL